MNDPRSDRDERMADYLRGSLPPPEQRAVEDEVLRDPDLAESLYEDQAVSAAMEGAGPRGRVLPFPVWVPVAAAAAAMVVVFLRPSGPEDAPVFRDATVLEPIRPSGDIASGPVEFVWSPDDAAVTYRIEVFDDTGLLFEAATRDTSITWNALPDGATTVRWRVVPVDREGLELPPSRTAMFRVSP